MDCELADKGPFAESASHSLLFLEGVVPLALNVVGRQYHGTTGPGSRKAKSVDFF